MQFVGVFFTLLLWFLTGLLLIDGDWWWLVAVVAGIGVRSRANYNKC